ncbi:stressosome-associated protein Prli42 [Gorillibacterium massiliense]|nr:stressosome-associated protein Prli42 [Gorillibacterium massiliense]
MKRQKFWFRVVIWVMIISMALSSLLFAIEIALS